MMACEAGVVNKAFGAVFHGVGKGVMMPRDTGVHWRHISRVTRKSQAEGDVCHSATLRGPSWTHSPSSFPGKGSSIQRPKAPQVSFEMGDERFDSDEIGRTVIHSSPRNTA